MKQKTYLHWGVTVTAAACAILVFYDTFFQDGVLFIFIEKLFGILKPVLYGLAMAYLLTPIVDFFDRLLRDRLGVKRAGLMRCLSILVTWLLALGLVYLLFSILIPELVASVSLLFSNLESYYRTIYTWVTQLVEDNPYISERVLTLVRDYYNELVVELCGYENGKYELNPLYEFHRDGEGKNGKILGSLRRTENPMRNMQKFEMTGIDCNINKEVVPQ